MIESLGILDIYCIQFYRRCQSLLNIIGLMRVFSFDPAEINMGFACFDWHNNTANLSAARQKLMSARISGDHSQMKSVLQEICTTLSATVVVRDLSNICIAAYDEKGSRLASQQGPQAIARAQKLKAAIAMIIAEHGLPDLVVIEFQMATNAVTVSISHQIMYEFCDRAAVVYVNPGLKNTIDLDTQQTYATVQSRYMTGRLGNKAHSRANLAYFLAHWPVDETVRKKIPRGAASSDVADALMQAIVVLKRARDA